MSNPRPSVVILAGPNGAGKSTAAPELLQGELAVNEFVNADVIARGLSAFDPDRAAMAATVGSLAVIVGTGLFFLVRLVTSGRKRVIA